MSPSRHQLRVTGSAMPITGVTIQGYLERIGLQENATHPIILHYDHIKGVLCPWLWYVQQVLI